MDVLLNKVVIVLSFGLKLLILRLLIKRQLQRRFFWFFFYIIYEILQSVVRFSVAGNPNLYLRVYWLTEVADVVLMMLAVRESFLNVFQIYTRLRWFMWIVWGAVALGSLYALFRAVVFPPVELRRITVIIIDLEVAVTFILLVVCLLYILLFKIFRIRGHAWDSGIIYGFGIYVCLGVATFVTRSTYGPRFPLLTEWLSPIGYILAEITWLLEFNRPEPAVPVPSRIPSVDDLALMNQYIRILERFLRGR